MEIHNDIRLLIENYKYNPKEFTMYYFLIIEKIRKFYSRSTGCCYLPPAKVWKIYQDEEYANRFCRSKIPDNEFILMFIKFIIDDVDDMTRIEYLKILIRYCMDKLEIEYINPLNHQVCKEDIDNSVLDKNEIFELIVILENRRIKLNEKYINRTQDFEYFYFIVLQMINNFCLKINNSFTIIDDQYLSLFYCAKTAINFEDKYRLINMLLDYVKEKCEELYTEKINPFYYRVLVKPTTWNSNKQSRF